MATLEEIVVQLTAETASLKAEMQSATKSVQGATDKMDKAIEEFSKNSSKNTSFFQTTMATMTGFLGSQAVLGAFGALKDAVGFLTENLREGAEEAINEERALAGLAQSLASSGNFSKEAAADLNEYAASMEGLAQTSQDVILGNLSILSSLTKLDKEGLKVAQTAAIELSAALNKDLGTTTEMVAKAINGNDMAFKKLGITMNLTSDKSKNLEIIMAALADKGGAAAAKMNTFGGALFLLKDAYGDVFKEAAKAITQNQVVISVIAKVSEMFNSFTDYIKNNGEAVRNDLGAALIGLLDIIQNLVSGLSTFFKYANAGFSTMATGVSTLVNGFMALGWALEGNKEKATAYFDKIVASAESTNKAWEDVSKNNFLDDAAVKIGELKQTAQVAFDEMIKKPYDATASLGNFNNSVKKTGELTKEQADILKSFATGLAQSQMALDASYQQSVAMLQETNAQKMALLQDDYAGQIEQQSIFLQQQQALRDSQYQTEQAALAQARANNLVTEQEFAAAKLALDNKYALDKAKIETQKIQDEAKFNKTRQENFKDTMNTIATLSQSGNKELAAIGKAAAITNATIDGYAAVQKALASAPPPFNFALAALVGAASAANVAKIAGVGLKSGITEVPRSAGGGNNGDNFPAVLQAGERVVDSQTNQDLKAFLANQNGGGRNVNITLTIMPGTGITREQAGQFIEDLNNYFASGGSKLVGAL